MFVVLLMYPVPAYLVCMSASDAGEFDGTYMRSIVSAYITIRTAYVHFAVPC
jgi:hypothetical protein